MKKYIFLFVAFFFLALASICILPLFFGVWEFGWGVAISIGLAIISFEKYETLKNKKI